MKITSQIILMMFWWSFYCTALFAMNDDKNDDDNEFLATALPRSERLRLALTHIDSDAKLITESLQHIKSAELHFFWTTGRTLRDDSRDDALRNVQIGGARVNDFLIYVKKLLEVSPPHLRVKLVLDDMTQSSNQLMLSTLLHDFEERFEILSIVLVTQRLKEKFSPTTHDMIDLILNNATRGIPVVASDIYRLIGMVHGHESLAASPDNVLFTYCDVDTFCHGMVCPSHKWLIRALFTPPSFHDDASKKSDAQAIDPQSQFYLGLKKTANECNNDLVKLKIADLDSYNAFCEKILGDLRTPEIIEFLAHFPTLHDSIRSFEINDETTFADFVASYLNRCVKTFTMVRTTTGPDLVNRLPEILPLEQCYPPAFDLTWLSQIEHECRLLPETFLIWGDFSAYENSDEKPFDSACNDFENCCNAYLNILSTAEFAERFGSSHPFNLLMKNYLIVHYPLNTNAFHTYLKINFDCRQKYEKLDYNAWLDSQFEWVRQLQGVRVLNSTLKRLGIEVSFSKDSLDFKK